MTSLEMLAQIAKGLGPLKDKVVFAGGSTVSLYLTDPGGGKCASFHCRISSPPS